MYQKLTLIFPLLFFVSLSLTAREDSLPDKIEKTDDPIERIELYIKLGDANEYTDPPKAIDYYQLAYDTGSDLKNILRYKNILPQVELLRAKSMRYKGIVQSGHAEYEQALESYARAKEILEEVRSLYTTPFKKEVDGKIAKLLNNIGIVYSRQGVFGLAREYYLEALTIHRELGDIRSVAISYSSLGIAEARQANLSEALRYFQEALDIYAEMEDKEGIAQSYNNIGGIYFQLRNWSEALELYTRAYEAFSDMGHLQRVAATLGNIGLVHQNMENYDAALSYMERSLTMRTELNDRSGIVESLNNIGSLYTQLNEFEKANTFYLKSLELAGEIGDQRIVALSLINIGRGYSRIGRNAQAIDYTQRGLQIARNHNLKFVVSAALEQMASIYAASGDFRNAYTYAREHYQVSQEILDEQKSRQINELEIEYKAREKQQRIEILEQEKELSRLQVRQSETLAFVLGLLFLVAIIVGVFTFLLINQRNKFLLLRKEQEAKSIIRKTDNDLQAIIKTHAHAMILFDIELRVVAFNTLAARWTEKFLGVNIEPHESFFQSVNLYVSELVNDIITPSMKGVSGESEKEFVSPDGTISYFKFFSNPVFDDNDQVIQSISLMIEDITERKKNEVRILTDLKEKETLVKEIHHRVKNNMQVIISLIRLQVTEIEGPKAKEAFRDLEQRIAAMSYVHEELYKSHNLADINFDEYLRKISTNLVSIYNRSVRVNHYILLSNQLVNIDIAVPCGLIVNELLTNALKHAFPNGNNDVYAVAEGDKVVDIFFTEKENTYELLINDNGRGLPQGTELEEISSMGFHLVKIISEDQLRGNWEVESRDGLKTRIEFPKK